MVLSNEAENLNHFNRLVQMVLPILGQGPPVEPNVNKKGRAVKRDPFVPSIMIRSGEQCLCLRAAVEDGAGLAGRLGVEGYGGGQPTPDEDTEGEGCADLFAE
jgi:hypothetical protein